jgi:SPP1 gp7 family putative phage head morphogenesis protein
LLKTAQEFWDRKRKAIDLNKELIDAEMVILTDGLNGAFRSTSDERRQALRRNLVTFVATKNYHQQRAMIKALLDEKGNIKSFTKYKQAVEALGVEYNKNWLKAEYNTTVMSSLSAKKWKRIQEVKRVRPYLLYKTQNDSLVRPAHRGLHLVAKHVDDPFWDTYYPPNGWNCRCLVLSVKNTDGYITEPTNLPDDKSHPPLFRNNPGKTLQIFTDDHPYFTTIDKATKAKIITTMRKMIKDDSAYSDIVKNY